MGSTQFLGWVHIIKFNGPQKIYKAHLHLRPISHLLPPLEPDQISYQSLLRQPAAAAAMTVAASGDEE